MVLTFDFDSKDPELIVRFDDVEDLLAFLVGFWEMLTDE